MPFKTPSGYLELWGVLNPIYYVLSHPYIPMIKFTPENRHRKRLTVTIIKLNKYNNIPY